MTDIAPGTGIVVSAAAAETLALPIGSMKLFAEGPHTSGHFSVLRANLNPGVDGARPHHHSKASELFFVISGAVDILVGDAIVTANAGDLAVVAPMSMHAFANPSKTDPADILIVFGPGIERFDYFRMLMDVVAGKTQYAEVLANQERFDNWFSESTAWTAHRAPKP
jgi:mannose-6-phosphate isomerase-like protein (cupin superfamily)